MFVPVGLIKQLVVIVCCQTAQQDIQIERETYQQSRQGLDCLYQEAKKKLNEEIQTRLVSSELASFKLSLPDWSRKRTGKKIADKRL